jgi:hypothetical protein
MAGEVSEFTYKTAPIGRRITVRVDAERAWAEDASSKRRGGIDLRAVAAGRWSEIVMRYAGVPSMAQHILTLDGAGGRLRLRLGENIGRSDPSENARAFYAACAAVLGAAAKARPELRIDVGPATFIRWLMSGFGAAAILLALVALLGAVGALLGRSWVEGVLFLALGASLGASGAIMATSFNPFRGRESVSAAALASDLAARARSNPVP